MNVTLKSLADFNDFVSGHPAVLVYFSSKTCGICHALKPKLSASIGEHYPNLALAEVRADEAVELAAQQQVFTVPVVIVYFEGKESFRMGHGFSLLELGNALSRPYGLLFPESGNSSPER